MEPVSHHVAAILHEDVVRYERVKKKGERAYIMLITTRFKEYSFFNFLRSFITGYVRLITNFGLLNLQLHCDLVPKTCENFIKLCQQNYYDGSIFHRSVRNFMVKS